MKARRYKRALLLAARTLLALTFLLSGWLKANDPVGFALKVADYAAAIGLTDSPLLGRLAAGGMLATVEWTLGLMLLCGFHRRLTAIAASLFMLAMTAVTLWLVATNPVSDCGCFGDMLVLTHGQSLAKNLLLLAVALALVRWGRRLPRLLSNGSAWMVWLPGALACLAYAAWCVATLPKADFRPYYVGADLVAARSGKAQTDYDVKIVYRRAGEELLLAADDPDPDSTWTYIETRSIPRSRSRIDTWLNHHGDVAELWMEDGSGGDPTDDILASPVPTLLLTLPDMDTADDGQAGILNLLYDYAREQQWTFVCLTASDSSAQARWTDYTGAEYTAWRADERTLWTMVRANPGLLLIEDGIVRDKWSSWNLPVPEEISLTH